MEIAQTTPKRLKKYLFDNEKSYLVSYHEGILNNKNARKFLFDFPDQNMIVEIMIDGNCITIFDENIN